MTGTVTTSAKELLAHNRARSSEMSALLRELVEIESPSTDAAGVAAVATRLARELELLGLGCEMLPVAGAGPILRARTRQPGRPVFLLGHLDTVWPLGTLAQRPVHVDDGVLSGPGAFDMKAGLVVVVFALRSLAERGALPPLTVFFTPLEEVSCEPYRPLMEAEMKASAACLDFEPAWPGGAVKTGRKGAANFTLRVHGRAAHAGADFTRGANAILELARLSLEASRLTDLERGVTLNVGVVRGGIRPNVIPDFAEAELDLRYLRLEDGRRAEAALRALATQAPGTRCELTGALGAPPLERGPHVVRVYELARAIGDEMGVTLEEVTTGGASEASYAAALGVPTLDGLGGDGDGAHAEDEHVRLASLPERATLAALLIERLLEA